MPKSSGDARDTCVSPGAPPACSADPAPPLPLTY
eukprot:gene438-19211_t